MKYYRFQILNLVSLTVINISFKEESYCHSSNDKSVCDFLVYYDHVDETDRDYP